MPSPRSPDPLLQRSLFDDLAPVDASGEPQPPPRVAASSEAPAAPSAAVPISASLPSAAAIFRHPQATREIRLREHLIGYALKRARRRSIGFIVGSDGLRVNAPKWVGQGDIDIALREKGDWILRKLQEQQERQRRQLASTVEWKDGTSSPFLGEPVVVVLDARVTGALLHANDSAQTTLGGVAQRSLHIGLPHTATSDQIRDAVQSWLQRQARRVFEERCQLYAPKLGVRYTRLSLSSAQTRWGSASSSGAIRLHWRLIHFGLATIDYVVTHELAHLREMNHSPRFWDVVRSVLPDYEAARGALKGDSLPVFE